MEAENKYIVRVTDNMGNIRIVYFGDVRFFHEDGKVVVIEAFTNKLKAVYPSNYAIEINVIANGNKGD